MKILMLGWELPPHNSGGLGVACYQMCKALAKRDVDIEFVVPYTAAHEAPFMSISAAHPQGATAVRGSSSAYDSYRYVHEDGHEESVDIYGQQLYYEQAVARLASERSFDIIHAHDWLTFRAALRVRQNRAVPLILHVHSIESDRAGGSPGNPLVREIEGMSMLLADRIVAVSNLTKRAIMREYAIPEKKISVIHNSLDVVDAPSLEADNVYAYLSHMKQQGYKIITSVGRLTVQKGLPNLLQAAKLVVEREPKSLFLIVGNGEQYFELIAQAAELGIGKNVLFAGFQRGQAWRDAFQIADLFVMPSVSEPFGLTPLEAIGFGTPVLISRQSGVSEVLQNCLKVDFWDINAMANQMLAVIRHPTLRDELYAQSSKELSRLSWDSSTDKLVRMYQEHLGMVPA